jgi:hypothetical protein
LAENRLELAVKMVRRERRRRGCLGHRDRLGIVSAQIVAPPMKTTIKLLARRGAKCSDLVDLAALDATQLDQGLGELVKAIFEPSPRRMARVEPLMKTLQ